MGWYSNDRICGNWMEVNGEDLEVKSEGWYEEDYYHTVTRIGDMREHDKYPKFKVEDIFVDPEQQEPTMEEQLKYHLDSSDSDI